MKLPENPKDRAVLAEFIQTYHNHQWLRGANIVELHPTRLCKTLEVHVNYRPVRENMELMSFAEKHGVALEFVQVEAT